MKRNENGLFSIPSGWTKDDFCAAVACARISNFNNSIAMSDIAFDLERCVLFGFSYVSTIGFYFDYSIYAKE